MYISRVVVRGYRSFAHLDVELQPGVTCVIGENNTGKTNLLHALRLVADANLSSRWRDLTEQDIHTSLDVRQPSQVIVSVEFKDYAGSVNATALVGCWEVAPGVARLTYRFRPKRPVRESIAAEERSGDLTLEEYGYEMTGGGGGVDPATVEWNEEIGASIRFGHLQNFQVVFLPALRDAQQDLSQRRLSPLARLFSSADISEGERAEMISIVRGANAELAAQPSIQETGNAVQEAFDDTTGDAFRMDVRLGMADPSFASIAGAISVLLSNESLKDFEPGRNGLGLNNVLYISMLTKYFERRIASPETAGQLLLVEEPEAHLHPQLQRVLYQALKGKAFQTIITSHSTHVSSRAALSSMVVLTNKGDGASASCVPGGDGSLEATEVADLERYLDATRSTILFARKVLLVEGPAELFLVPPLVKKVMGVDLDRAGVTIVPIYGTHFSAYSKLFVDTQLPKKCAVLTDGDRDPEALEDLGEEEDAPPPNDLSGLESARVKVFQCDTTFERTLALPGLLGLLAAATQEIGAPRIAAKVRSVEAALGEEGMADSDRRALLEDLGSRVLRTAERFGKARFAQVASKHVGNATDLPAYVRDAVQWLMA